MTVIRSTDVNGWSVNHAIRLVSGRWTLAILEQDLAVTAARPKCRREARR